MHGSAPEYFQVRDHVFPWADTKVIDITGSNLRLVKHDSSSVTIRFNTAEELVKTVKRLLRERKSGVHFSLGQS